MSQLKSSLRAIGVAMITIIACVATSWYVWSVLTFHGASDSDIVEIVQTQASSSHRVAILVRRSDHRALSGDTYFVFVNDRSYSVQELRKSLYSLRPIFKAGRDGITLRWTGPNELTIECQACGITKDLIETQIFSKDGVGVRYFGFP